jgi:hypothetical protein
MRAIIGRCLDEFFKAHDWIDISNDDFCALQDALVALIEKEGANYGRDRIGAGGSA